MWRKWQKNIVENILELNKEKQPGKGLKILTADQMLLITNYISSIKSRK